MHQSLKLGGTNYHFKWVKVYGTAPYWKTCIMWIVYLQRVILMERYWRFVLNFRYVISCFIFLDCLDWF